MGETILLIVCFGLIVFFGIRDMKARQDRESHEWWLSDVKACIHRVECEFQWRCREIAEEEFARQKFSEYKYRVRITELEETYKKELTEKVIAQKRVHITTIPDYLIVEYNRNISDIADTFRYFGILLNRKERPNGISQIV